MDDQFGSHRLAWCCSARSVRPSDHAHLASEGWQFSDTRPGIDRPAVAGSTARRLTWAASDDREAWST
jgi:hypothetical protein